MSTFGHEKNLKAPLGRTWDALVDVAALGALLPSVDNASIDNGGEFAPGFSWSETRTFDGEQFTKSWTVSSVDPYVSFLADGPGGSRIRYSLKPIGDEETVLLVGYDSGELDDHSRAEKLIQDDVAALDKALSGGE